MSKSSCFAVVLAVICLSVILWSLEADAHAIADESSPWSAATLEVRIIPSNQQQQNGKIKDACDEANETITLEEVANMVKIIASNQQENTKSIKEEIKNEIKDEIREVRKLISSGREKSNETGLEEVVKIIKEEMKNEIDELSDKITKLLVSGSVESNKTMTECDAAQTSKQALVSALVCKYLVCFQFDNNDN